jgi:arsenite methyltransferase
MIPWIHSLAPLAVVLVLCYVLARQLRRPTGWLGRRVMGQCLNRGNKRMLDAAVDALQPKPDELIVDIGFGGGYALDLIRERVAPARPVGVEISSAMIEACQARWGDAVILFRADVAAMPFEAQSQNAVLSVNTIYFWQDPKAALEEIVRILKPGGRLVLGIRRPGPLALSPIAWFGFRFYSVHKVEELMRAAGFTVSVAEKVRGEVMVIGRVAHLSVE